MLFTPNSPEKEPIKNLYLFTARIPYRLLRFIRRPILYLPEYPDIKVSWTSIPAEPLETLRARTVSLMPTFKQYDSVPTKEDIKRWDAEHEARKKKEYWDYLRRALANAGKTKEEIEEVMSENMEEDREFEKLYREAQLAQTPSA